jgi:integrase
MREIDQEGQGTEIGVPFGAAGPTCPVRALQAWLDAAGIADGPGFVSVTRGGRATDRRPSTRVACQRGQCDVARVVQAAVAAAGYDPARFGGHRLRAGFAKSAARAGVPEAQIMTQLGHQFREYRFKAAAYAGVPGR